MRGADRVICGAVGLVEDVLVGCAAPFEGCHGRPSSASGSGGALVHFRIAWIVVVKSRLRVASGRNVMQRTNSRATCCVCSVGERVGS